MMGITLKRIKLLLLSFAVIFALTACEKQTENTTVNTTINTTVNTTINTTVNTDVTTESNSIPLPEEDATPTTFTFVDAFEESYEAVIDPDVKRHSYDFANLSSDDPTGPKSGSNHKVRTERLTYEDDNYTSMVGVDVSHHQGEIDWESVKADGIEFVFIRIGFRGYGEAGNLKPDENALTYLSEAKDAGLKVGVYFYSQAINETEATEEAEFVLQRLNGIKLDLPVVYDPEHVLDDVARTDDVTGEQFTKNTIAFITAISDGGYQPAIYANMKWEAFELDLSQFGDTPIWYADYEAWPQSPYDFSIWQYSNTGRVAGISGDVDLDLAFIKKLN